MSDELLHPAERLALTICGNQVAEGRPLSPNTAAVCIAALARITGDPIEDWPNEPVSS